MFKCSIYLFLIGLFINSGYMLAQESYFVSSFGNDSNNGLSELTALHSLNFTLNLIKSNQIIRRIVVVDNIYEDIDIDNLGANFVTIEGKTGSKIVIQGVSDNKRIMKVAGNSNIMLINIEISNGKNGGISIMDGSNVILGDNVIIANNTTNDDYISGRGAGVYIQYGSLTMQGNSQIINNATKNNGGGVFLLISNLSMKDSSIIANNKAMNGRDFIVSGGGIHCSERGYCQIIMSNNASIYENISEGNGGGIFLGSSSELIMNNNSTITKNKSNTRGGGVWLLSQKKQLVLNGGKISENIVNGAGYGIDIFRQSGQ